MNFHELFEMQEKLDQEIIEKKGLEGQDLLSEKILAFQVEVAELCNEWRGFKFWSKDQEPRIHLIHKDQHGQCAPVERNPLLEEYVDGLHFLLSIGLEIGCTTQYNYYPLDSPLNLSLVDTFTSLMVDVEALRESERVRGYVMIFCRYLSLGEQLGFTGEVIEKAYLSKNKVNHLRQKTGY